MMCSTWKMSVFGLVALMLTFGLVTTDAAAQNYNPLTVVVTATEGGDAGGNLRAAGTATITLVVDLTSAATIDPGPGTVTIGTPPTSSGWSAPFDDILDTNEAGAVSFVDTATGADDITYAVSGGRLIATVKKDVTGTFTWTYITKVPVRAGTYAFSITSNVHKDNGSFPNPASITGTPVNRTQTDANRGTRIIVDVGSIVSGTGELTLAGPTFPKGADDYKVVSDPPAGTDYDYAGHYFIRPDTELGDLRFTYKAAGTMYKGSAVELNVPVAWADLIEDNRDGTSEAGEISVSGSAKITAISANAAIATITGTLEAGNSITFTYKMVKSPAITTPVADASYMVTANIDSVAAATDDSATAVTDSTDKAVDFNITQGQGSGTLSVPATSQNLLTGADAAPLVFSFAPAGVMLQGSEIKFTIPSGWTPTPFVSDLATPGTRAGSITGADGHTLKVDNRMITITLGAALDSASTAVTVNYNLAKPPATGGDYVFSAMSNSYKGEALASLAGDKVPTITVNAGHGSGTIALKKGGSNFDKTTKAAAVGDLEFVYTPGGHLATGSQVQILIPAGWTRPRVDNKDSTKDAGEIVFSSDKASLAIAAETGTPSLGWFLTLTTSASITQSNPLTIMYRNVKAPDVDPRSDTFTTRVFSSVAGAVLADVLADAGSLVYPSPTVGIDQLPDGSGTMSLNVAQANAGEDLGNLVFTFVAAGNMTVGAQVEVTIPSGWPTAKADNGDEVADEGETAVSGDGDAILDISPDGLTITATLGAGLAQNDTVVITYKNITAPAISGPNPFNTRSTVTSTGILRALAQSPSINVDIRAAGTVALANMAGDAVSSTEPGAEFDALVFTFTAGGRMEIGAQVEIDIPSSWTPAFEDNNDGSIAEGEVSVATDPAGLAGLEVSGGGNVPWTLNATTTGILEVGNTVTFTYNMVTAPSTEDTYMFHNRSSIGSGETLLPNSGSPIEVVVREPVAAIALKSELTSVFTGGEIDLKVDLWTAGGTLAKALGDLTVAMTSTSDTGEFSNDMGTIPDGESEWTGTYTDMTTGMFTLTATLGELSDTLDVEIKSTIRDLSVNGDSEMALVTQGSTFMVRATGREGGGTVQVLDSEGQKVGLKVGLDPIGEPDADGDQMYGESVDLPDVVADGMYTVSVEIQGDVNNSLQIQVVNDQTPPGVSNAAASEDVVVGGDTLTLSADVAMNESMIEIASVMADLGGLDTTKADGVMLTELDGSPGKYFTIITVASMDDGNEAEDGEYTITITATDAIGNMGSDTVMVTLENDPSELTSAEVTPGSAKPGETIWIKATGSEGASPTAVITEVATGMARSGEIMLMEMEGTPGSYSGSLTIVEDAHPAGMYDVTVTLGTQMMTLEGALTIEPPGYDFTLSIGAGVHLIHVPLDVTQVNGADMELNTVRDLFNALGDAVNIIMSLGADGSWNSYLGDDQPGMAYGDVMLGDSTGLVAVMNSAVTLELTGNALGTGGVSTIMLNAGSNLVGVPLDSAQITMISDVLGALVSAVVVSNEAGDGFLTISQAGDPGDGPLMGGEGYIVVAAAAASIPVIGSPWQNMDDGGMMSAPPVASAAIVKTPVLHVRGQLVDEAGMMTLDGLTVSVRNVTSGSVLGSSAATDEYSMTFVKLNSSAAKVGDILEIKADSGNPLLGIRPVQHVVTAEDVLNGSISLPDLVTYEIPAQSELLANYPNPFNPETWIPFRLAEDSNVSLDIYGASGALVRTIDLGFTPAAVYEGRSDAIYWDGRNNFGEQVSSGLYFYHLRAGEFSATRRMVVVK